tara:strand:+ start:346 stop:1005 length:660 start_codon:yes stop_codon:yes gene_type:complete
MIFYSLQKWWDTNGWTIIFICCITVIFILWFMISGKEQSSNHDNFSDALEMMVGTNIKKNFENTRKVFENDGPKFEFPAPNTPDTEPNFIYEANASKGENECRRVLQKLTGKKFFKVRPDFLQNPVTGTFLELDMFNDDLKLAVEYNGEQHDKYNKFMHQGSREKFQAQQYRDYIKRKLCEENNVFLIVVPHTIKLEKIENFLVEKLQPYLDSRLHQTV